MQRLAQVVNYREFKRKLSEQPDAICQMVSTRTEELVCIICEYPFSYTPCIPRLCALLV